MALMGYFIVFSFVTKPGQTLEFLLWGTIVPLNFLAGYYCSIVTSTPQPTVYAFTHTHTHTHPIPMQCSTLLVALRSHSSAAIDQFRKQRIQGLIPVIHLLTLYRYIQCTCVPARIHVVWQHWSFRCIASVYRQFPEICVFISFVNILNKIVVRSLD